ncbi:hypothetical protein ACLKA7_017134 [Drosophila subpalustris]
MNQVWLFYCIPDLLADIVCLVIHIDGSLHLEEPQPHNMIFCGTFAAFILIPLIRMMRILLGLKTRLYPQLLTDVSGAVLHFLCALLALHYAEKDFHLMFMGPQQELDHQYFGYCKKQSIACIIAGALYLLQSVLVVDIIKKTPPFEDEKPFKIITEPPEWDDRYQKMSIEEHDHLARTQANIYLLGRQIDHWLRIKSKWFRQLAGGQELINNSELHPFLRRQSSRPFSAQASSDEIDADVADDDDNDNANDDDDFEVDKSVTSRKGSLRSSLSKTRTKFDIEHEVKRDSSSSSTERVKPVRR